MLSSPEQTKRKTRMEFYGVKLEWDLRWDWDEIWSLGHRGRKSIENLGKPIRDPIRKSSYFNVFLRIAIRIVLPQSSNRGFSLLRVAWHAKITSRSAPSRAIRKLFWREISEHFDDKENFIFGNCGTVAMMALYRRKYNFHCRCMTEENVLHCGLLFLLLSFSISIDCCSVNFWRFTDLDLSVLYVLKMEMNTF